MKLKRQMIMDAASSGGCGWNRHQLELIGVPWPPKSGWINRIEGLEISERDYGNFVALGKLKKRAQRRNFLENTKSLF